MKKSLRVLALAVMLVAGLTAVSTAEPLSSNIAVPPPHNTLYPYVDTGWVLGTATSDCTAGWGNDQIQLTLTAPQNVTVTIDDCCCSGDFYELYMDGHLVGATPDLFGQGLSGWGCVSGWGPLSSGSMTVGLPAGTYLFATRDAGFDGHDAAEIVAESMCPAGYTVTGELSDFSCDEFGAYVNLIVANSGPYRNHGKCVSTAAKIVSPMEEAGYISEECASSIMNPIARSDCGK
jgi:hypothetical protein